MLERPPQSGFEEGKAINVDLLTTRREAREALMALHDDLRRCRRALTEAQAMLAQRSEIALEKWLELVEGLRDVRIPDLEVQIRHVEEKMKTLS